MSHTRFHAAIALGGVGLLVACAASRAQAGEESYWQALFGRSEQLEGDWTQHIRVGALVGLNLKAQFRTGGTFGVSGNNPGGTGSGVDHRYDDGYVLLDFNGNADGLTWNWGYQSTNQINTALNVLSLHAADGYTTSGSADVTGDAQVGLEASYGVRLTSWGSAVVGLEFGFGYLPTTIEDNQSMVATVTRTIHSYDVSGFSPPSLLGDPSTDGYAHRGNFSANGPLIPDSPLGVTSDTADNITVTGTRTLDATLYSFRLGPTFYWELHPRFAAVVSAGAAVGIVAGDLEYDEALQLPDGSTAHNQGKVNDTDCVYGGYLAGTLIYHAVKNGDLYLGFQYMPLTSATLGGNGREAKLDLSGGLYFSAGINWPF